MLCRAPIAGLSAALSLLLLLAQGCGDDTSPTTGGSGGEGGSPATGGNPTGGAPPQGGAGGSTSSIGGGGSPSVGGSGGEGGAVVIDPPPCPPGTTELALEIVCDAGAAPPSAMATAMEGAVRGDVVTLGADIDDVACLPVRSCTPEAAPTLIFSDEPEYVDQDGVLYADEVEPGRYRLYLYHVNDGTTRRRFTAVALNQGSLDVTLQVQKAVVVAPDNDYLGLGRDVALGYFSAPSKPDQVIAPDVRVVIDSDLDALVADPQELVHAILEIQVNRPVKISIVSVPEFADAAAVTAGLSLLPNSGTHVRGTFPLADRLLLAQHIGGLGGLRLGGDLPYDPHLEGTSEADGNAPVTLAGNFGLLYDVRIVSPDTELGIALNPRGGDWAGAMFGSAGFDAVAGILQLPTTQASVSSNDDGLSLGNYTSNISIGTKLLSAGGSSLPIVVAAIPIQAPR